MAGFHDLWSSYQAKREFWGSIEIIASRFSGPWLIVGDFNAVLRSFERVEGRLMEAVDNLGMIELNASGGKFS